MSTRSTRSVRTHSVGRAPRAMPSNIRVVVRKRPLNQLEKEQEVLDIVDVVDGNVLQIREQKVRLDNSPYEDIHEFSFHRVFGDQATNVSMYTEIVQPLVREALEGSIKNSVFAFGQTGSGKTHTMIAAPKSSEEGLVMHAVGEIFRSLPQLTVKKTRQCWRSKTIDESQLVPPEHCKTTISMYEIYCGKLYDLFNNKKCVEALENSKGLVVIKDLTLVEVHDTEDVRQRIERAMDKRVTAANAINDTSSRSHAVIDIKVMVNGYLFGALSFIDLAGAERGSDAQFSKTTSVDGAEINKSLLALKECIRALDNNDNHIPFRASKLTKVLRHCLIGGANTVMIANVNPSSSACEPTLNTIRYAERVAGLTGPRGSRKSAAHIDDPGSAYTRPPQSRIFAAEPTPAPISHTSLKPDANEIQDFVEKISADLSTDETNTFVSLSAVVDDDTLKVGKRLMAGESPQQIQNFENIHNQLVDTAKQALTAFCNVHKAHLISICKVVKEDCTALRDFSRGKAICGDFLAQLRNSVNTMGADIENLKNELATIDELVQLEALFASV